MSNAAVFEFSQDDDRARLRISGDWTLRTIAACDAPLRRIASELGPRPLILELHELGEIDTAGALILDRTIRRSECGEAAARFPQIILGEHAHARALLGLARQWHAPCPPPPGPPLALRELLERVGRASADLFAEIAQSLAFIGELAVKTTSATALPYKLRWASITRHVETTGLDALPIVAALSLSIGMVLAFLIGVQLQDYGATPFTVELVAIAMMREFGVVLAAIVMAGRTCSAFAAEIGAMRMQQEIDALRVMGLDPMEVLVIPRLLGLVVALPILALVATIAGTIGGALISWTVMGITPGAFLTRLESFVPISNLWVGLGKAPVFAAVITVIGCRQGMLVERDVISMGARVTAAVVQAIFAVIMIDAAAAIIFQRVGL